MSTKYIVNNLSGQTINGNPIDPRYKVFTALLTQSGGDGPTLISFDDTPGGPDFIIGVTYQIDDNTAGLDVTNIGAPNNEVGTYFIATGTRPTNWGEGSLSYNAGAPVATVLENTIGAISFSYTEPGKYNVDSSGLFTITKMVLIITAFGKDSGGGFANDIRFRNIPTLNTSSLIPLEILGPSGLTNDALYNTPIEIRVYN